MNADNASLHRRSLLTRGAIVAAGAAALTGASAPKAHAAGSSFTPIAPFRAYDSRNDKQNPVAENGKMYRIDVTTDEYADSKIPPGAKAVVFNLTLAGTRSASGYLSIVPGHQTVTPSVSTINWGQRGLVLANGGTVMVGNTNETNRHVNVFCGGGGMTPYLIDVTGYYA